MNNIMIAGHIVNMAHILHSIKLDNGVVLVTLVTGERIRVEDKTEATNLWQFLKKTCTFRMEE
jgi:hypothetical protein